MAQAADAGTLTNTATVTDRVGGTNTANASVTVVIPNPSISLDKQAGAIVDGDGNGQDVGDTIAFTFLVTNTGNVTLSSVGVSDPTVGPVTCPPGALAPGGSKTCTATYALTQANVNAGVVNNTATASGTSSGGTTVTATDNTSTTITRTATLTLDKQAGPIVDGDANGHDVGDTIAYTFLVTNTGNVTLTAVGVTDPKVGTVSCPLTTLAPGASTTCTATYALTQADVNAGVVNNTATATGTPPAGVTAPTPATDNDLDPGEPHLGDRAGQAGRPGRRRRRQRPGRGRHDRLLVHRHQHRQRDPDRGRGHRPDGRRRSPARRATLAPGASKTCTATLHADQADVDAGHVATPRPPRARRPPGVTAPTPATDSTDTLVPSGPAIVLDKQAGPIVDGDANGHDVGDTIAYSFVVTNTGNVTLTARRGRPTPKVGPVTCPPGSLAPGAAKTCTATYMLTQADVNAGVGEQLRHRVGHAADGPCRHRHRRPPRRRSPAPRRSRSTSSGRPIAVDGNGTVDAGDTIAYSFLVTNTGNVTLTGVGVTDRQVGTGDLPGDDAGAGCIDHVHGDLHADPGRRGRRALRQHRDRLRHPAAGADGRGRRLDGHVESTGDPSARRSRSPRARSSTATATVRDVGDTIAYEFLVTNTGNVTLTAVGVDDPKVGAVDVPGGDAWRPGTAPPARRRTS